MKKIFVLTLIIAACAFAQGAPQTLVKTSQFPITLGYTVEFPKNYDTAETYPLIVGIHGFGDRMSAYVGTSNSFCPDGAFGLYPESPYPFPLGEESPMGWTWWYWSDSTEPVIISNDLTLKQSINWIVAAIKEVEASYPIDPSKVFLFGFSQGGFLTFTAGTEHPELFRGLLPAGGWMEIDTLNPKPLDSLALRVPVRALHGYYDNVVEYAGAEEAVAFLESQGVQAELLRYPVKHQLTNEMYDDARDFIWCQLNSQNAKPLVELLWPPECSGPEEHSKLLKYVLCAEEPLADIEAGLLDLFEKEGCLPVRQEIIYLLGARRCTGAEPLLTSLIEDKAAPQPLRQAAYTALVKLATESAWKKVESAEKQLVITKLAEVGQAAEVGLEPGDVILRYNRKTITTNMSLREAIASVNPEKKGEVVMIIERAGERLRIKLRPGRIGVYLEEQIK